MLKFTMKLAQEIFSYTDPYPIYLDDAWQWLGYPDKASTKSDLKMLTEGLDYIYLWKPKWSKSTDKEVLLTIEGFMILAFLIDSKESNDAIEYFIACGWK
jgi:hypothetical protein